VILNYCQQGESLIERAREREISSTALCAERTFSAARPEQDSLKADLRLLRYIGNHHAEPAQFS
jgi:hypothetical protein